MHKFNPSGFLFPLAKLTASSTAAVSDVFEQLCLFFSTGDDAQLVSRRHGGGSADVSLARLDSSLRSRRKDKVVEQNFVVDSGYASAEEDDESHDERDAEDFRHALQLARNDPFERDFTIRWLTGFIARSSVWIFPTAQTLSDEETEEREALVEKAASLLSSCSGASKEDEALTREFIFSLGPPADGKKIHVELNDLLAPEDHSSVGLQSWASAIHFARMMSQNPSSFGITSGSCHRILELGAGTGLLSITAVKILHTLQETPLTIDIIATDYHPGVLANLQRNVDANNTSDAHPSVDVQLLDWQDPPSEPPFDAVFDVILAADVVYDPSHTAWIRNCVERLLKRPTPACPEGGVFWMVLAVRNTGRHEGLAASVFDVFPLVMTGDNPSEGLSLKSVVVQDMERSGGVGRMDESGYRLFKICWA